MDREAWHAAVHGVTKSWTWLSEWTDTDWLNLKIELLDGYHLQTLLEYIYCFLYVIYISLFYAFIFLRSSLQEINKKLKEMNQFSQFSHSVVSDSLWPHGPQHVRPPCPSPTPRVYPNPCPLSRWCHPTISSSVVPFSSCPQFFTASGSFQMSQFFTSGGQSIGVSASTSVLPMSTQDWSPLGWTGWISLQSKGFSRVFSNTTVQKHQSFGAHLSL